MTQRELLLLLAGLLSLAFAPAPFPRTSRDRPDPEKVERLYATLGGTWRTESDAPLDYLWLHRGEKAPENDQGGSPWRLALAFDANPRERFTGAPARIEADGDALKITLPPPEKGEDRGTRSLRICRVGDRLLVRVIGGRFEGT